MAKLIRTDLPEFIWEKMETMARDEGLSIGVYAKRVLIRHVEDAPKPVVDIEAWNALKAWVEANPVVRFDINRVQGRAAKLKWARERGFEG